MNIAVGAIEPAPLSKTARDKQLQADRIAQVNHWRGQCLDNFARAEHAIIRATQVVRLHHKSGSDIAIHESAANRTRELRDNLRKNWPKLPLANQAWTLLDHWSIREKQRNDLVHGRFSIKPSADAPWLLINDLLMVKKGATIESRSMLDAREADAFLKAITTERKGLEATLQEASTAIAGLSAAGC